MMTFEEALSLFVPSHISNIKSLIEAEEEVILFLGYPTCPYCHRLVPKLGQVVKDNDLKVYYVNSKDMMQFEEVQAFRRRYGIATVPALFVSRNGASKVVCDSSLSEDDIIDFIN